MCVKLTACLLILIMFYVHFHGFVCQEASHIWSCQVSIFKSLQSTIVYIIPSSLLPLDGLKYGYITIHCNTPCRLNSGLVRSKQEEWEVKKDSRTQ